MLYIDVNCMTAIIINTVSTICGANNIRQTCSRMCNNTICSLLSNPYRLLRALGQQPCSHQTAIFSLKRAHSMIIIFTSCFQYIIYILEWCNSGLDFDQDCIIDRRDIQKSVIMAPQLWPHNHLRVWKSKIRSLNICWLQSGRLVGLQAAGLRKLPGARIEAANWQDPVCSTFDQRHRRSASSHSDILLKISQSLNNDLSDLFWMLIWVLWESR